jgi:aspartate racemase
MKMIGLIGGMSWESSLEYYRIINERVAERLGGLHSARCILWSFDFDEIESLQHRGDWDRRHARMIDAARSLERAGADFLAICTNTMHRMAPDIEAAFASRCCTSPTQPPMRVRAAGMRRIGLLGTRFTMEQDFYRGRLSERHGLDVVIPDESGRQTVHDVIYNELCRGVIRAESRAAYREIIAALKSQGCEGVILGCTEIGLLIQASDSPLPLFDTTHIHAEAAADWCLSDAT